MRDLTIVNIDIRRDAHGRYSFNDLHRAAVTAGHDYKTCQVSNFTRLEGTEALIAELRKSEELEVDPWVSAAGRHGGTWGCKELVYAYAMWISPAFHLRLIRAYDAMVTQPQVAALPDFTDAAAAAIAWAEQFKAKQALALENAAQAEALAAADAVIMLIEPVSPVSFTPKPSDVARVGTGNEARVDEVIGDIFKSVRRGPLLQR